MGIILVLLPLSILLALIFLGAYLWGVKRGQFDDLDTPPLRVMHDDEAL
jgi:cbb3-type cytochrome oxidase maturation protein